MPVASFFVLPRSVGFQSERTEYAELRDAARSQA